jgi:hypothetical protein
MVHGLLLDHRVGERALAGEGAVREEESELKWPAGADSSKEASISSGGSREVSGAPCKIGDDSRGCGFFIFPSFGNKNASGG